ncbi:MAG: regulatory protein RecX [Dysosmobacter welbionis]
MRIERVQASPHKKGRVLVFLEDGACLKITEQEALDFGLRTGDDLDGRRLEQLKKAASVSDVKATAADLIGKRAMSRRDLERKLQEKGASQAEARYAAEWLEAIGAINDAEYAAVLVRHCADLGYGPARMREKLREKGVPRELWDEALDHAADSADQIDRFLTAKLRGRAPEEAEKRRLTSALLRRGFAWEISGPPGAALGRRSERNDLSPQGMDWTRHPHGAVIPRPMERTPAPGPLCNQSIDWRNRSCHTTFPLSPWAAPRIR